jgi:signal recognition particle receptor subunit beta
VARAETLEVLADIARDAGLSAIADASLATAERLRAGLFYVVCVGQFKRGKSTLLNALVGLPLLPIGVVPVTSTVTIVRHGERLTSRVRFVGHEWEDCDPAAIERYVSEEHNPGNEQNVVSVEVAVPSTLLARGLCLVDTPGLGSVVVANTIATRAFVPHVDAAILVLGSDPPITAEELALVREMKPTVREIIVVFNKADRSPPAERMAAIDFTERLLEQALGHLPGPILQVSAQERLVGRDDGGDWAKLVARLTDLARKSGADLVGAARKRETADLISSVRSDLDEQRATLLRPIQDSEKRLAQLRVTVGNAERSLNDLAHLLNAEQERLVRRFSDERAQFFDHALAGAQHELKLAINTGPGNALRPRAHAIDQAQAIARRCLERWLTELEPRATTLYREAEGRFVELVNGFRDRVVAIAGLENVAAIHPAPGFRAKSGFYYTEMMNVTATSPVAWMLDHAFPWWRHGAIQRAVAEYLEKLIEVNSARIKNDFDDRLTKSRRHLEYEISNALHRLVMAADTAVNEARRVHAAGAVAVNARVDEIEKLRGRLNLLERSDYEAVDGRLA